MSTRYVVLLDRQFGLFRASFPGLPDCSATGVTLDEVLRGAAAALAVWIKLEVSEGRVVPPAKPLARLIIEEAIEAALAAGKMLAMVPLVEVAL